MTSLKASGKRDTKVNETGNDAPWRRNYDLAHEFFHLITWDYFSPEEIYKRNKHGKNRIEQLADVFASAFLLPEEELRNEFKKRIKKNHISYLDLTEIAREFDVSIEALLWRLVNLNLIEKDTVIKEFERGNIKDFDKKFSEVTSFLKKYGYNEDEDYSVAYDIIRNT